MLPTKFRFIWPSGFKGEDFLKSANQKQELPVAAMIVNIRPIRNKNCLWRPCLLMDHEMSNLYRGPSIDASYQVFEIQKQELPVAAMFVNGSGRNELSL